MSDATLDLGDQQIALPIIEGSMGDRAIDITQLRKETGFTTFDRGFGNTAETKSDITFINGSEGMLLHRGYDIEELASKASFLEVAYLLMYGELPTDVELAEWQSSIMNHCLVREDMRHLFEAFPHNAHPMSIVAAAVSTIGAYYPEAADPTDPSQVELATRMLLGKMPTMTAWTMKYRTHQTYIYPDRHEDYASNFLNMAFGSPDTDYDVPKSVARIINMLLVLHADHEQNCSAATVRIVGSSHANIFSSIAAGIHALGGPLHGGANQAVLQMLQMMVDDGGGLQKWIDKAKDKNDPFLLMGFGHRVYRNFDPRSRILKTGISQVLEDLGVDDPLLDMALELEDVALNDDYFITRKLFPNVDFYSGIIYRAIGFPQDMFTVLFALGRLPGWIAQWREMHEDPTTRIGRPRQIYQGPTARPFVSRVDR